MVKKRHHCWLFLVISFIYISGTQAAQKTGGIRGMVYDKDFDIPLAYAEVRIAETGEQVSTTDQGNFVFSRVQAGTYTLVFSKEGYARQVKANVVVSPGKMTEVDASLSGEFVEMEEFLVQDLQIGPGTEAELLELRMESPGLLDSVGSELMSQAGASDAASALKLVSGATTQDGKFAVIRGLPDRYVSSQMNGVRLPTADADKRAVELDQFPAAVIESVRVSKTFTPDQQGDASGGAVNVVLKGIPDETSLKLSGGTSWNTNVRDADDDFLTYKGGGLNFWGRDDRDIPEDPGNFEAAGVSYGGAPWDYKWSISGGGRHEFDDGLKIGGFGSFFYERDSSFFEDGVDDNWYAKKELVLPDPLPVPLPFPFPDDWFALKMQPRERILGDGSRTSLFNVTQASEQVQWGTLGVLGLETDNHLLTGTYMYTRDATEKATLAEDTRGKEYFYPGYDPYDPDHPGNSKDTRKYAAYRRSQALEYTERTTETLQLSGHHKLLFPELKIPSWLILRDPELDWNISSNSATMYQPDKRLFASYWVGATPEGDPEFFGEDKGANINLGNFQRIWKDISEESEQLALNLKFPFEQWSGNEGYLKLGLFEDQLTREYEQESFSNIDNDSDTWQGHGWDEFWSDQFPSEEHVMVASPFDVDYDGQQDISAWYYMVDMPVCSFFDVIGGVRYEKTELSITNDPDRDEAGNILATYYEPETGIGPMSFDPAATDVSFAQDDILPSIGFEFRPWDKITLRGGYSETVARQTFKELSPIAQSEYIGGDVFIGNPKLKMSALKNYDLRLDYRPYDGGLFSMTYFKKTIENPIEYELGYANIGSYIFPINYPKGKLSGFEFELRQKMGRFGESLDGLSLGANATFIDSEVTLPEDRAEYLKEFGAPSPTRDMVHAPEHLYNLFMIYDFSAATRLGLFYTIRGDSLVAGARASAGGGSYTPHVYETEYGTLNLSLSHKLGDTWKLNFAAKNLLDPKIESVYRSRYIDGDVTRSSYRKGMEFSISLSATF